MKLYKKTNFKNYNYTLILKWKNNTNILKPKSISLIIIKNVVFDLTEQNLLSEKYNSSSYFRY